MEKIDQTIEVICDETQSQINNEYIKLDAELIKALAALITAKANLNMSVRMYEGKGINQSRQR